MAERYYRDGDDSGLPRSVATKAAFENAMSPRHRHGGSTNTVLHLLAIAREAGVDFTMADIDRLSRRVPVLCKVAPNGHYHVQDVNRAGGHHGDPGDPGPCRAGRYAGQTGRDGETLGDVLARYDVASPDFSPEAKKLYLSAPAGRFSNEMGSQQTYYPEMDTDRAQGCIRDVEHAYFQDGGLAVLKGNIAADGCIVKTAGVDPSLFPLRGNGRSLRIAGTGRGGHPRRTGESRPTWW